MQPQPISSHTNTATFYRQSNVQPVINNNIVVSETLENIVHTPVYTPVHTPINNIRTTPTNVIFNHSNTPVVVETRTY
jgi:hypothetical protein